MKKDFWKQLLQIIIAILTAISSTLFVQSCVKSNSSSSTAPQHVEIGFMPAITMPTASASAMKVA
jgi:hypothetical protein